MVDTNGEKVIMIGGSFPFANLGKDPCTNCPQRTKREVCWHWLSMLPVPKGQGAKVGKAHKSLHAQTGLSWTIQDLKTCLVTPGFP